MVTTGRAEEVERLYREHGQRLWRAVYAFAGDRELASDAVAESFAQALRRGQELREPLHWIWRAAFRIAAGQLKERGRYAPESREGSYEMEDPTWDLIRALLRLSASQRAAVVLHYYADHSIRDTAAMLGSTPGAVRVHLHRARKQLKALLESEHA